MCVFSPRLTAQHTENISTMQPRSRLTRHKRIIMLLSKYYLLQGLSINMNSKRKKHNFYLVVILFIRIFEH